MAFGLNMRQDEGKLNNSFLISVLYNFMAYLTAVKRKENKQVSDFSPFDFTECDVDNTCRTPNLICSNIVNGTKGCWAPAECVEPPLACPSDACQQLGQNYGQNCTWPVYNESGRISFLMCCRDLAVDAPTFAAPETEETTQITTVHVEVTTTAGCRDQNRYGTNVTDCPEKVRYCTIPRYLQLMQRLCPATCGFCASSETTDVKIVTQILLTLLSGFSECFDKSAAGKETDCTKNAGFCFIPVYLEFMKKECPKTCATPTVEFFCRSISSPPCRICNSYDT
ncbi:unnamed protein product [Enterobius vermicularis]|uniref:ShKT domain-containing protein n=1 Tax=Enterobius vermicularis TaxID=51028 RepID=A0A0N4VC70_ENTVE|nr:unnamed protein product [Enterobius vermicularis]